MNPLKYANFASEPWALDTKPGVSNTDSDFTNSRARTGASTSLLMEASKTGRKSSYEKKKSIYFNEHASVIYSRHTWRALNMNGSQMTVMANVQIGHTSLWHDCRKKDMITPSLANTIYIMLYSSIDLQPWKPGLGLCFPRQTQFSWTLGSNLPRSIKGEVSSLLKIVYSSINLQPGKPELGLCFPRLTQFSWTLGSKLLRSIKQEVSSLLKINRWIDHCRWK